jgi:hypothetical protein
MRRIPNLSWGNAILRVMIAAVVICHWACSELADESLRSIEDRVREAKFIVLGRLGSGKEGKNQIRDVHIEKVLLGNRSISTAVIVARFKCTNLLIPGVASTTGKHGNERSKWILFLTDEGVKQDPSGNKFQTRAIGKFEYAHHGLELADLHAIARVEAAILNRHENEAKTKP